jgi:hypothetical protein
VIPLNTWTQVSVVFDGDENLAVNRFKFYINGQQSLSDTSNSPGVAYSNSITSNNLGNSATNTAFGAWFSQLGWIGYFDGQLDDIGIWNRALSASEIQQLYTTQVPCTLTNNFFATDSKPSTSLILTAPPASTSPTASMYLS